MSLHIALIPKLTTKAYNYRHNFVCVDPIKVNISEEFERHTIQITLEWTQGTRPLHSYIVNVVPPTQLLFNGVTSVAMNLSYNVSYNLAILIAHVCIENPVTVFTQPFYFSEYQYDYGMCGF